MCGYILFSVSSGFCTKCRCHWEQHKHITYECDTRLTHAGSNRTSGATKNESLSLGDIDKRICDLRKEKRQIEDVYKQLVRSLHANAILPINDDFPEYVRYFIREEQMKQNAGVHNTELISNLKEMMADYTKEMELFKKTLEEQSDAHEQADVLLSEDVFTLVGILYHLPINGQQIRDQVNGIQINQGTHSTEREKYVELPAKAASSALMLQLQRIISSR